MTQLSHRLSLPNTIAEKLQSVRKRSFKVRLITAVVASVVVLLAAMGLAMLVDYLAVLYDSGWRSVLTMSALVAAGATLVAWILVGWRYTRRLQRSAQVVEQSFPDLEERWTTVTSVSSSPAASRDVHPAMYRQVASEANRWSGRVDSEQVVRYDGIVRALICLSAVTAILVIAVLISPRQTTVLMRRFWAPQAYISATEINHQPEGAVIGRGESLDLVAQLDGLAVKSALLMLEPTEGEAKQLTLVPHGVEDQTRITHRIRTVKSPLRYRFRAGDGQTPWYEVAVADRPRIAATQLTVTPPAYTRQDRKQLVRLPRRLTVLEGSTVEIAIKPEFEVKTAQLLLGSEGKIKLSLDEDGWYRWHQEVNASFSFSPLLTEAHGLTNRKPPKCRVVCQPDRPPVVKVLTPKNEMAVRPDDALEVTFVAKDDVGISQAELIVLDESTGGRSKPKALKIIAVDLGEQQGEKNIKATVRLDLQEFELPDGAQLSYVVRVREDRGQASPSATVVASDESMTRVASNLTPSSKPNDSRTNTDSEAEPSTVDAQGTDTSTLANSQTTQDSSDSRNESAIASADPPQGIPEEPRSDPAETQQSGAIDESLASTDSSGTNKPEESSEKSDSEVARTARSGEQRISTEGDLKENSTNDVAKDRQTQEDVANASPETQALQPDSAVKPETMASSTSEQEPSNSAQPRANQTASNQNTNSPGSQDSQSKSEQQSSQNSGDQPPPDNFAKSTVDIAPARSASSQQMRIKVDQWAGSFEGQQRRKLELVVGPLMDELDQNLRKAQELSRVVLDELDGDESWRAKHNRDVSQAEKRVMTAIQAIEDLENQTHGTPYAFIGLQLLDISRAHVEPARRDFWKALQSDSNQPEPVRNGWQHTRRARELLTMLTERFERAQREYAMAESVAEIKKMHRIFIEESMGLLQPQGEGDGGYSRKAVEFDLDQDYLDRLKEVMEMRNRMRRELARILREDPRLLRRYLDSQKTRRNNLRNDLYDLVEAQRELNREVSAWSKVEEGQREQLSSILLGRHVESAQDVSLSAAELLDRFQTWSPLESTSQDQEIEEVANLIEKIATTAGELTASSDRYVAVEMPSSKDSEPDPNAGEPDNEADAAELKELILDQLDMDAETLYDQLSEMEVQLRQLGLRSDRLDMASFATNRLVDTRKLVEQSSGWVRQLRQQRQGNYHRAAEVAQYRVARDTETLVAKLADVEQTLVGLMQRVDGKLPPQVAAASREMFTEFDENATPNQQAAIYALRRNKMTRAAERQDAALAALEAASEKYDAMIKRSIEELDKLPVQDPIAGLLDDPTLDELLAQLEQELPIQDLLGIPPRSSNLRIVTDFLQPAGDNGVITGQYSNQLMNQMRQQQRLRRRQLDRAYRNAMSRALNESNGENLVDESELKLAGEHSDWNVLLSQLGDDLRQGRDKAPPERYRRAIEQYFRQISRDRNADE